MFVTLFKSDSSSPSGDTGEDDNFLAALRQANFAVNLIPVVSFNFFNLDFLWRELKLQNAHGGLIFTSPRCVESLHRAIQTHDLHSEWPRELRKCWLDKPIYCVGPSTIACTLDLFKKTTTIGGVENDDDEDERPKHIMMSEKGNSESLAKTILAEAAKTPISLPLLYPCGNLKTDKLGSLLDVGKIPYKTLTVYQTGKNPALEKSPPDVSLQNSHICVFFSPSGVSFTMPHLTDVQNKKFIALGPTTREALENIESIPSDNVFQCPTPTPQGLLQVLESLNISPL